MKQIVLLTIFVLINKFAYSQQQITHASLIGAWTYFYITTDYFSTDKIIATEQRLIFQDGQNVTLVISAKESEFVQNTTYELKYSLSLRDNVPYLSLFSPESTQVLGAYMRMPLSGALELAADPNFNIQKQLYKRLSPNIVHTDHITKTPFLPPEQQPKNSPKN